MTTYNIRDRANLFRSGQVSADDIADAAISLDKLATDVTDYVDTAVSNVSVDLTGYATETYVDTAVSNLIDTAPTTLDTLNELAAALNDDANFATTVTTALGLKADTSSLATVATSGLYSDLTGAPTIPTVTSDLTNDSGFITSSSLTGLASETYVDTAVSTKQDTLVSGTDIKTVNGESILGSGDITIASSIPLVFNETYVVEEQGQTTFSVFYDSIIGVFVNGVKLRPAEYTATSGTNVVLNSGLSEGFVVDIIGYLVDTSEYTEPIIPVYFTWGGDRGVFAGGSYYYNQENYQSVIDYVSIANTGNATAFGNLTAARQYLPGCSNITRGVFFGGNAAPFGSGLYSSVIDYITFATPGNATSFGNLLSPTYGATSCSDGSRGLIIGGYDDTYTNQISYITIATTGNATSFGNQIVNQYRAGAISNLTRGVYGGTSAKLEYVTIQTLGNATSFGDLLRAKNTVGTASDKSRGLFYNANNDNTNSIEYITVATAGNATYFGSAITSTQQTSGSSNGTRAIFSAGKDSTTLVQTNRIEYVTIQTLGNATNFGNLTTGRSASAGASGN